MCEGRLLYLDRKSRNLQFDYQNNTYQRVESFVGCNITHVTPRDASVGSRTRDSSFKFEHAAVIKRLIR